MESSEWLRIVDEERTVALRLIGVPALDMRDMNAFRRFVRAGNPSPWAGSVMAPGADAGKESLPIFSSRSSSRFAVFTFSGSAAGSEITECRLQIVLSVFASARSIVPSFRSALRAGRKWETKGK
ncbi:MAG: hypothetical protein EOP84_13380 [Verrucomicrobiaceae bacterium]|nr:MAG: hypothetical protein EOP84_13380 [Verrucomicrobiaceae bacterium]